MKNEDPNVQPAEQGDKPAPPPEDKRPEAPAASPSKESGAGKAASKERPAAPKKGQSPKRYNVFHRIAHLSVTFGVTGAAITGFPLKFKDITYMDVLTAKMGGVAQMALYHRVFAVMIGAYIVMQGTYMMYYFIAVRLGQDVSSLSWVLPRKRETLDVRANALYLFGKRGEPSFKKQVYWGVFDWIISIAAMWAILISGAVVWFPEIISRYVPGTWLNVAYVTHSNGAVLAIVITVATHFYNIYWSTGHMSDCNVMFSGKQTARRKKLQE